MIQTSASTPSATTINTSTTTSISTSTSPYPLSRSLNIDDIEGARPRPRTSTSRTPTSLSRTLNVFDIDGASPSATRQQQRVYDTSISISRPHTSYLFDTLSRPTSACYAPLKQTSSMIPQEIYGEQQQQSQKQGNISSLYM